MANNPSKALCIIPARGGSKRVPNKNLKLLAGKPLVSYTIEAAKAAGVFSEIWVSSDNEDIRLIADDLGVKTDRRPGHLAGDFAGTDEVVEEFLLRNRSKENFDYVAMLLPTCPFRSADDISNAFNDLEASRDFDFLIGIAEYDFPPQLALCVKDDGKTLEMREPAVYKSSTRTQSLTGCFRPNGAIYIAKIQKFLETRTFFSTPMMAYVMPAERSFDIDDTFQFKVADVIASLNREDEAAELR